MSRESIRKIFETSWSPETLKTWRKEQGLSQQQVADMFGFKYRSSISRLESGKDKPTFKSKVAMTAMMVFYDNEKKGI